MLLSLLRSLDRETRARPVRHKPSAKSYTMMNSGYEPEKMVKNVLSKSDELAEWLYKHTYDFAFPDKPRSDLAVRSLYIALEHHKPIVLLSFHGYCASASALRRPLFEAFVNGLWITSHASEKDLGDFVKKGQLKRDLWRRVNDIEENQEPNNRLLSMIKKETWSKMCNYVHTGMEQLSRHKTVNTIEPNFTENEIIEMLIFANTFGLAASCFMKLHTRSTKYLNEFAKKAIEYDDYHESILSALNVAPP